MATQTSSYDGWTFFNDGSMVGPSGQTFDANLNQVATGDSVGVWSGLGNLLNTAASVGLNTWSQKTLMQTNAEGQRYLEGQRLSAAMQQQYLQNQGMGGIPPWLLIAGLAVVAVVMMKS